MEKINASFNLIGVKGWLKKAFIISVVKILLGFSHLQNKFKNCRRLLRNKAQIGWKLSMYTTGAQTQN